MTPSTPPPSSARTKPQPFANAESLVRTGRQIQVFVWLVAVGVMVASAGTIYTLARDHHAPVYEALPLAVIADAALVVGLLGDRGLSRHGGERAGWGIVLIWATALMTLGLNTGGSLFHHPHADVGGALMHAVPPVLLVILTEAASAYQQKFAKLIEREQRAGAELGMTREAPTLQTFRPDGRPASSAPARPVRPDEAQPSSAASSGVRPPAPTGRSGASSAARPRPKPRPDTGGMDVLLPVARRLALEIETETGKRATRESLAEAFRRNDQTISNERGSRLIRAIYPDLPVRKSPVPRERKEGTA